MRGSPITTGRVLVSKCEPSCKTCVSFEAMAIKLLEGRLFDERDGEGATPVIIVNQTQVRTIGRGRA